MCEVVDLPVEHRRNDVPVQKASIAVPRRARAIVCGFVSCWIIKASWSPVFSSSITSENIYPLALRIQLRKI